MSAPITQARVSCVEKHTLAAFRRKQLVVLQAKFGYRLDDPKWAPDWLPNEQLEMLHSDIDARQIIDGEFDQILKDLGVSTVCQCVHALCDHTPAAPNSVLYAGNHRSLARCNARALARRMQAAHVHMAGVET